MLVNTTIEGLKTLRLDAMAAALAEQHEQAAYSGLGFEERLGLLVDRELTERSSRRLERCLKTARLRAPATVEDIDFRHPRGLDRAQILTLAQAHWAQHHHAIVITGPTGAGKTYLACALAHSAIRHGHTALYLRAPRMFDDLAIARADGRLSRLMAAWARSPVTRQPTCSKSSRTGPGCAPPSSPASFPSATGTRPSATPPSPTPPWTGCWKTLTASSSPASPCAGPRTAPAPGRPGEPPVPRPPRNHRRQAAHDTPGR